MITITPENARLGATVTGVDLHESLDGSTAEALRAALVRHEVLFFPAARLSAAEQIRSSFAAATREVEGRPVDATVSIGVVIAYDAVLDLSALLAQADHALYRAKDAGRNRIEIASIELILDRAKRGTPEFHRSAAKSTTKTAA